jgi:predicted protein tyrosine phosphatase
VNYDRIDVLQRGVVWQGGAVDETIEATPFHGPILIICMDAGESNEQWINHSTVEAVLAVWIDDRPEACLRDQVLLGLVDAAAAWLDDGGNLYIHCHEGRSRASYFDIALHCRVEGMGAAEALGRIRERRQIADPNPGFMNQLIRLFPG